MQLIRISAGSAIVDEEPRTLYRYGQIRTFSSVTARNWKDAVEKYTRPALERHMALFHWWIQSNVRKINQGV